MMPLFSPPSVLPASFQPSVNEVIIGRGKRIAEHCGNKRLHAIVRTFVKEYSAAPTKRQKSDILTQVVHLVRQSSAHKAGFVKQDTLKGGWCIVEDAAARITVAQSFRDALHINYKSSKQFKQQKRQDKKGVYRQASAEQQAQPLTSLYNSSEVCSPSTSLLQSMKITLPGEAPRTIAGAPEGDAPSSSEGLSALFRILEASIDVTVDPFEPTPIPEANPSLRPCSTISANSVPSAELLDDNVCSGKLLPSTFVPDFDMCLV